MKPDRQLGMDRDITRRDLIHGVGLAALGKGLAGGSSAGPAIARLQAGDSRSTSNRLTMLALAVQLDDLVWTQTSARFYRHELGGSYLAIVAISCRNASWTSREAPENVPRRDLERPEILIPRPPSPGGRRQLVAFRGKRPDY